MSCSVLLDTSFLISLVNQPRANHDVATHYYKKMLEDEVPMYLSSIAIAEFCIKQPITDLPLKNFRLLAFNALHGINAAGMWDRLSPRDPNQPRHVARDDIKLIAQAAEESIHFILTEDNVTLAKYCERLRAQQHSNVQAIKLSDGFNSGAFDTSGQYAIDFESDSGEDDGE